MLLLLDHFNCRHLASLFVEDHLLYDRGGPYLHTSSPYISFEDIFSNIFSGKRKCLVILFTS